MCNCNASAYICKGCKGYTPWSNTSCPKCLKKLGLKINNNHIIISLHSDLENIVSDPLKQKI
jgi:hypothetical protein